MFCFFIKTIEDITPEAVKKAFKIIRFDRLLDAFYGKFCTRHEIELVFQRRWAGAFIRNKHKVLEYWERYRYLREIKNICNITPESIVLDVGCGICTVLHYIDGTRFGIDPLAEEYSRIYDYPEGINISKGLAEDIDFPPEYFDIVFCSSVLDHLKDRQAAINEIHRVLKSTGCFVLTVEIHEGLNDRRRPHIYNLTKSELYGLLKGKFEILFERQSPWIGVRDYVYGLNDYRNQELILVLKKAVSSG